MKKTDRQTNAAPERDNAPMEIKRLTLPDNKRSFNFLRASCGADSLANSVFSLEILTNLFES